MTIAEPKAWPRCGGKMAAAAKDMQYVVQGRIDELLKNGKYSDPDGKVLNTLFKWFKDLKKLSNENTCPMHLKASDNTILVISSPWDDIISLENKSKNNFPPRVFGFQEPK